LRFDPETLPVCEPYAVPFSYFTCSSVAKRTNQQYLYFLLYSIVFADQLRNNPTKEYRGTSDLGVVLHFNPTMHITSSLVDSIVHQILDEEARLHFRSLEFL